MTPTEYLSLVYNRHDVCVLCVCTRVLAEVCFDCVLVLCFVMGFVLQRETAHEKCIIIIIKLNLTVTFVTGTSHNM